MSDAEQRKLERAAAEGGDEQTAWQAALARHRSEPAAGHLYTHAFSALQAEWQPRIEYFVFEGQGVEWSDGLDEMLEEMGMDGDGPSSGAQEEAQTCAHACLHHVRQGEILQAYRFGKRAAEIEADTIDRGDAWGGLSEILHYALWRAHQRVEAQLPGAVTFPGPSVYSTYADDAELDGFLKEVDGWAKGSLTEHAAERAEAAELEQSGQLAAIAERAAGPSG